MKLRTDLSAIKIGRVQFRASERAAIYEADNEDGDGEQLVAVFDGDIRVRITKPFLKVLTDGDVWWIDHTVDQTNQRTSDLVYTSLDRPAPLSPEMLRLEQMIKRNAIDRERIRSELEEIRHERTHPRNPPRSVDQTATSTDTAKKEAPRKATAPSDVEPTEQKGGADQPIPDAPVGDGTGTNDQQAGPAGDQRSQ